MRGDYELTGSRTLRVLVREHILGLVARLRHLNALGAIIQLQVLQGIMHICFCIDVDLPGAAMSATVFIATSYSHLPEIQSIGGDMLRPGLNPGLQGILIHSTTY